MRKLKVKDCPLCGRIIWQFKRRPLVSINKAGVHLNFLWRIPVQLNAAGREFWILQTDGSKMRVAICKTCFYSLTDEQVRKIFADIIYTKLEALKKDTKNSKIKIYKLFDRIRTIEVFKWFGEERMADAFLREQSQPKKQ